MNKENFEIIKTNLEARIAACKLHLDHIITTEDLKNISVGEAQALKTWAKQEQSIMDQVITAEFYHIVGMGELTVTQMNLFIKLMKEYMNYRSDIKTISWNLSIDTLPGLPSQSEYKLKHLGDFKLASKIRGRNEAASIFTEEGTSEAKPAPQLAPGESESPADPKTVDLTEFSMQGRSLFLPPEKINTFIKLINPGLNAGRIKKAIENEETFAEATWRYLNSNKDMVVAVMNPSLAARWKKILKK